MDLEAIQRENENVSFYANNLIEYHTFLFGIDVKIPDILIIFIDIGILALCTLYYIYKKLQIVRLNSGIKNLNIGPFYQINELGNSYTTKSGKNLCTKKKSTIKSSKQTLKKEQISCQLCQCNFKTEYYE
ncbi:hypothetical protein ABPG72_001994 [Tetrahymena utriculariae]